MSSNIILCLFIASICAFVLFVLSSIAAYYLFSNFDRFAGHSLAKVSSLEDFNYEIFTIDKDMRKKTDVYINRYKKERSVTINGIN